MAVEGAIAAAMQLRTKAGIELNGDIGLEDDLVQNLVEECELDEGFVDTVYNDMSDMFEERVVTRAMQANPTFYTPQLIRESSNCPSGITVDVLGLLDVGLMHHNMGETKLAVATYIEALRAWLKHLPATHTEAQAVMFCLCAIGGVLESDSTAEQGHYDPIALSIYMLAAISGESKAPGTTELALAQSCMGAALFHIGHFDRALECFLKASLIRTNLALEDVHAGQSVTAQEMAIVYNNTAVCHAALDENVEALGQYRKAFHIFREHCGPSHMYTACVQRNLDKVQRNMADHPPVEALRPTDPILRPKKEKKKKGGKKKKKK